MASLKNWSTLLTSSCFAVNFQRRAAEAVSVHVDQQVLLGQDQRVDHFVQGDALSEAAAAEVFVVQPDLVAGFSHHPGAEVLVDVIVSMDFVR